MAGLCVERMGRHKDASDADRFLLRKGQVWYYRRRVPPAVADADSRAPHVRISLKTRDLALARVQRDAYERADNEYWASLHAGDSGEALQRRYAAAVRRAEALGLRYRSAAEIAQGEPLAALLDRIETLMAQSRPTREVEAAVLGGVAAPVVTISGALKLYVAEIAAPDLVGKSAQQKRKWRNVKQRAVTSFVDLVGDLPMVEIGRDQALVIYRHWLSRIAPAGHRGSHTASSGNRDLGALRTLFTAYFRHLGDRDRPNPFAGLTFAERKTRSRPPVPTDWIASKLLRGADLAGLNGEARGILLANIETGARPSELANLDAAAIRLEAKVPHLAIAPREDPDNPRELKTATSRRLLPLVGVALAVFQRFPAGFPRYREREEAASATINKYLHENDLLPSPAHTLYSLRHSLEDRMKEGGLGDELRRILMGHRLDRETYGSGGGLEWRRDEMLKIALPFDPAIV